MFLKNPKKEVGDMYELVNLRYDISLQINVEGKMAEL